MTNAQMIFELAISLMDEVDETTGNADTADTAEYKNRTLSILNVLRGECFRYSDTWEVLEPGKRPICPIISDFEGAIAIDDGIAQGVMPYGLAAHLLLDENPTAASYFNQRYQELLEECANGLPSGSGSIENVYGDWSTGTGGIEYGEFSRW